MRNLSRGRLDGPGKIPIRSSSLPRSFSTSNSALWNRSPSLPPCKDDLQTSISLSDTAASFTALDDIIEDGVETLAMDITSTSPVEDIIVAAISDESSISCEEHSRPPPSTSLENTYRPVEDETTLTLPASGRAVSRPPTSKRKKRCNRAKRPSDISHLVSKVVPLRARRELKRRLIAHRSSASTSESVALDTRCDQNEKDTTNTFIDPIVDEKAHAPAMHASVSIPVEKEITLDEELLHSSKAIMQPSTMLVVLHDTNPTVNTDTLKPDYSRSIIMRVLQSTDPSKSRWQQETIANALSTINFWSSLRQKESLGV
ncbi:hypothetical protein BGX28_007212 [Mortierella sp. GBA30]|nr:hypothetical protein BGX28_007212 [Mortierella sp. GBA30]